uniref:Alpha-methylacyl-CoA racemase n=1 Tax=Salmo trutta TaxID=8032 RepID=A0A674A438_SALTR
GSKRSSLFFSSLSNNECRVMEKLGMGPEELLKENPRLIYSCLTGYGLSGAKAAGHDINYLVMSGLLSMLGRSHEKPYAPLNLVADFAGGGLTCAFRVVLALLERTKLCRGQVIDASMVRTRSAYIPQLLSLYILTFPWLWLCLGLDAVNLPPQMSFCDWPELRQIFTYPAPVLSRTPADPCLTRDPFIGEHTRPVLEESGFKPPEEKQLLSAGIIECNAAKAKL